MEWSRTVWHRRKIWSGILWNSWAMKIHNFQSEKKIICISETVQDFFCKLDMKPHMHFFRKQTISLLKNDQVFYGVPGPRNLQKKWRCIKQFLTYMEKISKHNNWIFEIFWCVQTSISLIQRDPSTLYYICT